MGNPEVELQVSKTPGATANRLEVDGWHLEIPAGSRRRYRLAQLDDHGSGQRKQFPWQPPLSFSLEGRVSAGFVPGTWGFGFWNDPFSLLMSFNKPVQRLPTLPEAAWFFYASPQSYLSFRDDLPANSLLAATFSSRHMPAALLALASPIMALSFIRGTAQWVRRLLRQYIKQDAAQVRVDPADWHAYRIEWLANGARFHVDGRLVFQTGIVPRPPLSLVIWIDDQYAAFPPHGRLKFGYQPNPAPAWLEIKDISVKQHA